MKVNKTEAQALPETERMIREENLSSESRENLLFNLMRMRRSREV